MKINLKIVLVIMVFWAVATVAPAQNVCSKQTGDAMKIFIRNASEKAFTVNYVDENCKESSGDTVEPGKAFSGDATGGDAFRVRETGTNNVIQTVVANPSNTTTTIGIVKNSDPSQSFIQTLNQIRRGRNLPEIELNDSLTKGCQWFADLMAKFDKGGHDAVLIGGNSYKDMQNPWDRSKKMGYVGDGGTEATGEGDVTDIMLLGGDSMIGWASSSTHYRPFLAMDGQMFKQVGFGYAKSAKKPNYYYTCAVFGNPEEDNSGGGNNNAGNNQANVKEPIKTNAPDGLKFTEAKFYQMQNGTEKYGTSFVRSSLEELNAEFSFENPSGQPFNVELRTYFNGKMIDSQPMKDLKGTGSMSILVAGKEGEAGRVQGGNYRFEVLLNGEVVLSAEATVK